MLSRSARGRLKDALLLWLEFLLLRLTLLWRWRPLMLQLRRWRLRLLALSLRPLDADVKETSILAAESKR